MRKIVTSAICACAVVLTASACDRTPEYDDTKKATGDAVGTTGDATAAMPTIADIVGNPSKYLGQTVTVEADVEEVFGPRAFSLDEDSPLSGGIDRDLLVLGKQTSNLDRIDDQWLNNKVRVTGKVGRISLIEVEREVGWDLDPEIETELEGAGAVIFADSVTRIQK